MFDYTAIGGIKLATLLDTRKPNADGTFPIRIRITYKRVQKYYSTNRRLSVSDWDKLPTAKAQKMTRLKEDLQKATDYIKKHVEELADQEIFSFNELNKRLGKATDINGTLNAAFTARIDNFKEMGKVSTADWYKYTLRSIELFAKEKSTSTSVEFKQITVDWLRRYEQYLLDEGKSYTTVSMYMRALQVIVNEAKSSGVIKQAQHPFGKGKYEIPQHEGRSIALNIKDIGEIVRYECETDTIEMCRDLWFFSYLCNGANITDICKLRYSSIRNGEICFYRQKTLAKAKKKKLIHAQLLPEMQTIIDRWGNAMESPDTFIFPFLQGGESPELERTKIKNITKLMNTKMKVISKKLGIPNISTYTARHSYATVLKRSGANIAFISESLGHNDLKTTENYLASFEQEERVKNAALLTNF
ncbi:site-specific integrase [Pontibacter roseus]|uniref:site-specific integrase n=1 Tax=Pontibacter roseus TaxID=336989 RepID=UPI0003671EA6|nr:site-specific integrase [Pontibacter roseus]